MSIEGLTQGLFGKARATLAPSLFAMGPNTYLDQRDFLKMLGAAFLVHVVVIGIASLFPGEKVTNIPVRALSFKLGDQDRVAAFAPMRAASAASGQVAPPVMQAPSERIAPTAPKPTPAPVPVKPQKIRQPEQPRPQTVAKPPSLAPLPEVAPPVAANPAIASQPQQYVRESGQANQPLMPLPAAGTPTGAIGGQGVENTQTAQTAEAIRQRYEQQISSWIERHKLYPAGANGKEGRVVVRMRIDRAGAVRYYALEQSSGNAALDAAAIDMIRRANPVPAVPINYPAGNLIEFLIPITFQAPR